MKKTLRVLFLGLLLMGSGEVKGQFVTIPDPGFVLWLNQAGYSSCMNGNQLDTTCPAILLPTNLNFGGYINCCSFAIDGIEYFRNVVELNIDYIVTNNLPNLPPGLKILHCQYCGIGAFWNLPIGLEELYCNYNQISHAYNFQLPPGLIKLDCPNNQLVDLPALPSSLTGLSCAFNQLTTLPALPSGLDYLDCNNNMLTTLPSLPGYMIYLSCDNNFLDSLPMLTSIEQIHCDNNFLTYLPTLPFYLKYLYCNNNQLDSLPILPPYLNWLECENNFLTTLPSFPSTYYLGILAGNNMLTDIPDLPDTTYILQLNNNPDLGCLPPFKKINTLNWTGSPINCLPNGSSVDVAVPPLTNIPFCQYGGGCHGSWSIFGYVYEETIANCNKDTNEYWVKNIPVRLDSGGTTLQIFSSTTQGYYFKTGLGNYELSIDTAGLPFDVICPPGNLYNSSIIINDSLDADLNFGVQCKPGYVDLAAKSIATSSILRPGVQRTLYLQAGSASLFYGVSCAAGVSGFIQVILDSLVSFVSEAPGSLVPSSINGDTLTWNISDFSIVNPVTDFNIIILISTSAGGNTNACFQLSIISNTGDNNLSNNTITNCFQIRNSYDPNAKDMYPAGIVDTTEHAFTFTIYFQNTGNAPAENIYVLDTLDGNLNPNAFQYLSSSHDVVTQLLPENILRFSFPNINLPDSVSNEPKSHGYVQFKINRNDSVYQNMTIQNKAHIYFDFNPPIVTNDVFAILDMDCNTISNLVISDSSLCDGELFSAFNSVFYVDLIHNTWMLDSVVLSSSGSGIALSGIVPGNHSISLISSAGNCYDSSSTLFTVNANPLPLLVSSNDSITSLSAYNSYQWYMNGSAMPGANQNTLITAQSNWYSLFVTDSNGCSGFSDSVYIFDCKNLISFAISDTGACENEIILASNNGVIPGLQNSWFLDSNLFSNNPAISISGLSAGFHTLSLVVDTSNCNVSATQPFVIYPLPKPVFTISNDTLSSVSIYNVYQWLLNNSAIPFANQNSYVITQNGFYSLQAIDSNGCIGVSDSIYVGGTGITELTQADFTIFPNPADDVLHISISTTNGNNYEVELLDITGRKLMDIFKGRRSGQSLNLTIPIEKLNKGVYLLRVNHTVRYFVKG